MLGIVPEVVATQATACGGETMPSSRGDIRLEFLMRSGPVTGVPWQAAPRQWSLDVRVSIARSAFWVRKNFNSQSILLFAFLVSVRVVNPLSRDMRCICYTVPLLLLPLALL